MAHYNLVPRGRRCRGCNSLVVRGRKAYSGVLKPFEFKASTPTIVLQQIIALKTIESKFYVATPCAALISALGIFTVVVMKVPY